MFYTIMFFGNKDLSYEKLLSVYNSHLPINTSISCKVLPRSLSHLHSSNVDASAGGSQTFQWRNRQGPLKPFTQVHIGTDRIW